MKKLLALLLIISMLILGLAACNTPDDGASDDTTNGEKPDEGGDKPDDGEEPPADACEYATTRSVEGRNTAIVTMKIKGYGTVKLLLDATSAPVTVANFLSLAKSGFYDGLSFYSAQQLSETAFVIMSGATSSDGYGGSYETVPGEFSTNGHNNDLSHKHGVISMFHSGYSNDDATSHFFIVGGDDLAELDGYYAPFGYVIEGLPVVDKIIEHGLSYTRPDTGLIAANRQPKIESVTVEQDIDYSPLRDKYIAPPMPDELNMVHTSEKGYEQINAGFAHSSVKRIYKANDGGYIFQIAEDTEDGYLDLLFAILSDGTGGNVINVSDSEIKGYDALWELIYEKTRDEIGATEIPEQLKTCTAHAFRALDAINSDGSASKYVYTRDTEDRETYTVEMKVEGYETPVVILLDKTTAPITVENFLSLVKAGFYDGLDFHRIIKGFMIQGGDDSHLLEEEQAASIKGEFESNGHANDILHLRGTISMARATNPDSASSGFFICDADSAWLDGEYAAFGYVLSGMETVDAIADYANGKTDKDGNLNADVAQPKIEYIKLIEE